MNKYTKEQLRSVFQRPFDKETWKTILIDIFRANNVRVEPEKFTGPDQSETGWYMGNIETTDNYRIGLFFYRINIGSVAHKKVGLRNLVKSWVNPNWGKFDAAIVVFSDGTDWRLSFVCDIKDVATAPKRFTFVFGEKDNFYRTPIDRFTTLQDEEPTFKNIHKAFSVEALSDDFFDQYRDHYADFVEFITGKRYVKDGSKWVERVIHKPNYQYSDTFGSDDKLVRDYIKKMFGRIVFLFFLQRKGWLDGNRNYMHDLFVNSDKKDDFLEGVLEPLFFEILNTDKPYRTAAAKALPGSDNIPYLNGGLFAADEIDELDCKFPESLFSKFFNFLDSYNFTIDENDIDDAEIGIDPEMLGRIFENLLEDNKDKGAFYTPKEIVDYMCRESIIAYLQNERFTESGNWTIRKFVETYDGTTLSVEQRKYLKDKLKSVKICDPAIGSGAFPMGLVNLLSKLYSALRLSTDSAVIKRHIMEQNIYGVDIEKGAVDIARLRFWLAMIVEEKDPIPLPNLHFKIMQGNSLLESYQGVDLSDMTKVKPKVRSLFDSDDTERETLVADLKKYYETSDHAERDRLFNDIIKNVRRQLFAKGITLPQGMDPSANEDFFLWHTWFADVFENRGFDIVIGNPPYVSAVNMARTEKEKKLYKQLYPEVSGAYDLYILFLFLGCKITSNIFCWIVPNKVLIADYAKDCVTKLKSSGLRYSLDVSSFGVFKTASVYPIILLGSKSLKSNFEELEIESYSDLLINKFRIKEKNLPSNFVRLTDCGLKVCSGATGFEATMLKQYVTNSKTDNSIPFTVSGNIDPYTYNNINVRYMKGKYNCAHMVLSDDIAESKIRMWQSPKIVIAGMTKRIEACYVEEALAIGVGCYAIFDFNGLDPYLITGIINSKPVSYYLMMEFKDKHLAGGYLAINKSTIEQFLLPKAITDETSNEIARLSKLAHKLKKQGKDTSEIELKIDIIISKLFRLDFVMFNHIVTKDITREEYESYE